MIPLNNSTRKLQAFLAGTVTASQPQATIAYYDVPRQTKEDNSEYRRATQFTTLADVTETDICDAPPDNGTIRNIEYISIYNADTASATVTVCIDDNGTNRIQVQSSLATTESLVWTANSGWQIVT